MRYRPTYRHQPGHSAYDHMADETIYIATQCLEGRTYATRRGALHAGRREAARAWQVVRPRPSIGPSIVVDTEVAR